MSRESIQFTEMIRQAAAPPATTTCDISWMYCDNCARTTQHQFRPAGAWEHYYCTRCGSQKSYKVR